MKDKKKYLVLIQARCGSSRLPNKVLKKFSGKTDIQWVVERVKRSKLADDIMVVTSIEENNLPLVQLCASIGVKVFVGSENDVLDRYYQAAKLLKPDFVVRITADCPMFDWRYLDMAIEQMEEDTDYLAEMTESFPDGLDIEIIKFETLTYVWKEAKLASEREHVTLYIKNHNSMFNIKNLECPIKDIGNKRWTLDENEDFELISNIYNHFICIGKEDFVTEDILEYLLNNPELERINEKYSRNEGLKKSLQNDRIIQIEE